MNTNFIAHIKIIYLILSFSVFYSCNNHDEKISVIELKCEYLINPLGIDVKSPRLSWKLFSNKNYIEQTAYQIIVASNLENLKKNIGDLWDSKKIISDQSIHIKYLGKELISRQKVFWKVKIWDQKNVVSSWSEISTWEMGLLNKSDWYAKWIGKDENQKVIVGQKNPAIYLRKQFNIVNKTSNARIYISGLGYYELYINGKKVGDHVLSPNQTNYDKRQEESFENGRIANMSTRILYETFEINKYLVEGENVISVILGNGWYFQNEREEYLPLYFDSPRLLAQLEIQNLVKTKTIIVSDDSWKINTGPILDNNLYHGEIYDARLEIPNWNLPNYDDSKCTNAKILRAPEGKLCCQMSPPDRIINSIKPISISKINKTNYRYDFGTMFSGWVKLNINGKRGDEIKLTFFEDSGNSFEQSDTYFLKGNGNEIWEPCFTWHAFRFVEVNSPNNSLSINNIEGRIVNTDVSSSGKFVCSNQLFNRIQNDYRKTQLGNIHGGVPSDCPHRERRGYTGDGQISAQAAIYNFDMHSFYTKWLKDISDAQNKKTGYVPNTVPYHGGGGGTAWGSAFIIIPWYMYLYYGDVAVLEEHYDGMKNYINYLKSQTDSENLIIEKELGEWVPPTKTEIPPSFVSSAYYYYDLKLLKKIANILGKTSDSNLFSKIAEKTKKSFNKRYLNLNDYNYSIGRQGANVFPLAFELVPKNLVEKVFANLVKNIVIDEKGHFDTGMMATPYLLEVFTKYGRTDLAYTIMNRRDFPSFGYNIERGATSIWETWIGHDSHSHPMFGSVCAWFNQSLGGINPDPGVPGFKHVIIKPELVNELDYVNSTYQSMYGEIKSNWEYKNGNLKLSVNIPPNTYASVYIPGNNKNQFEVNNSEAKFIGFENGLLQFQIPSGEYIFISKNISDKIKTPMVSIPIIDPPDSILFSPDSVLVNIRQYSKNSEIRFTIDGSEPNINSLLFTKPFTVKKSTTVKAKVFRSKIDYSYSKSNRIIILDSLKNGLNYKYYIGAWQKLPDFSKLNPHKTGKMFDVNLNQFKHLDDKFGIVFNGEIEITKEGKYTFYLLSNDGSKLWIDNKLIADSDNMHVFLGNSGSIILAMGKHKIQLNYFQAGGGKGLELQYEGPNIEKQKIPADVFFTSCKI
ncbi:MAG: family 78 glycoside hydrolase catalytic domain [Ignavibacteriae bacterium]|nr:family 78 glycoside hydrolase catalytic domain [Ignavibacteriota bacterium]